MDAVNVANDNGGNGDSWELEITDWADVGSTEVRSDEPPELVYEVEPRS